MVAAQHPLLVRQQLAGQPQRLTRVTHLAGPGRDVVAGRERAEVVAAQHPLQVRQQRVEQPQRLARVPHTAGPGRDVVAGRERVGVVGPQFALDPGLPALPTFQILGRDHRFPMGQALHHAPVLPERPQVLGLPSRRVAVQRVSRVVRPGRGQLGNRLGQGAVRLLRIDAEGAARRIEQVIAQGLVEQAELLALGPRTVTHDQAPEVDQDVANPVGTVGPAQPAGRGAQQRQGQDRPDTGGRQEPQDGP